MFMPIALLKKENPSTEVNKETLEYHQNLSEMYFRCYKQMKVDAELDEKVTSWLFSHDIMTRVAICTLDNNFTSKLVQYIFKKFCESHKTRLKVMTPNEQSQSQSSGEQGNPEEGKFMPNFYYSFDKILLSKMEQIRKDNMEDEIEKIIKTESQISRYKDLEDLDLCLALVFNEIKFFSLYLINDAVTLSTNFLETKSKFMDLFKMISGNNCFKLLPKIHFYKEKLYMSDLPSWVISNSTIHLGSLLIGLFEQTIIMRFVVANVKKLNLSYLEMFGLASQKLSEVFLLRKNLAAFLEKEYPHSCASEVSQYNITNL